MKKPKNIGGKFYQQDKPHEARQTGWKKAKLLKTMKFLPFPYVTIFSPRWSTKRIALPLKC